MKVLLLKTKYHYKTGFTLIELLVVIAIIGILAAIGISSFEAARANTRDARRASDVTQIQKALFLYVVKNGDFPKLNGTHCIGKNTGETCWGDQNMPGNTALSQAIKKYMTDIPSDPSPGRGWGDTYMYLDGAINVNCTPASDSGQFILYRPEKQPASQSDCRIGTYACCGTGGPCSSQGGYYCALKLE